MSELDEKLEVVLISYDFNFLRGVDGMVFDKIRFTADNEVYEIELTPARWQVKSNYAEKADKPFLCYKKDLNGVRFMIRDGKGTKIYTDIQSKKIMRL